MLAAAPAHGCSTFLYGAASTGLFVARNYDWDSGEALVVANKKHVSKVAIGTENPAKWVSKHGSLTFCQYGREFPCGGIWLHESEYPQPDERPVVTLLQWVQYQLDTASSVSDVIASDEKIRVDSISGSRVHYFVADKTGSCATVEFLQGRMVVHRGANLPVPALTNSTYAASLRYAKSLSLTTGEGQSGQSGSSLDRFSRAVAAARGAKPNEKQTVDYGFKSLLDLGRTDYTKWRIVYELSEGAISFRTNKFPKTKRIRCADFDFAASSPVMVCDMNSPGEGNVASAFQEYDAAQNRKILMQAARESDVLEDLPQAKQLLRWMAKYPDHCGEPLQALGAE
jgi:choloylglycine hydrolase